MFLIFPVKRARHLLQSDVPALQGPGAGGTVLGVQPVPAALADGVTVHTLPDASRRPHFFEADRTLELRLPQSKVGLQGSRVGLGGAFVIEKHLLQQLTELVQSIHLVLMFLLQRIQHTIGIIKAQSIVTETNGMFS